MDELEVVLSIDKGLDALNTKLKAVGTTLDFVPWQMEAAIVAFHGVSEAGEYLVQGIKEIPLVGKTAGAALELVGTALDTLGTATAIPAKLANTVFTTMGRVFHDLQGPLGIISVTWRAMGQATKDLARTSESLPLLGRVVSPFFEALSAVPATLDSVTESLVSMAQKASPGQFHQWQMALEDTQGVIGRTFLPVFELMTRAVRGAGDALASLLPDYGEVTSAMSELKSVFGELGSELNTVFAEIGPGFRELITEGLQKLAHWAAVAAKAVGIWAKEIQTVFGVSRTVGAVGRSSGGASAAGPAHMGGVEDYQRQLQLAAFVTPGKEKSEEAQAVDQLNADTQKEAETLISTVKDIWAPISAGIDAIKEAAASSYNWAVENWPTIETYLGKAVNYLGQVYDWWIANGPLLLEYMKQTASIIAAIYKVLEDKVADLAGAPKAVATVAENARKFAFGF